MRALDHASSGLDLISNGPEPYMLTRLSGVHGMPGVQHIGICVRSAASCIGAAMREGLNCLAKLRDIGSREPVEASS